MLKKSFIQNSFKYKLRIIRKFGHAYDIVEKPLIRFNEMKVIWKFLNLRCEKYWILSSFVIEY
jgi:hypothetical protein